MKLLKMISSVAMAALMAMAFAGAGTAMAEPTTLCIKDPGKGINEKCPEGQLITHVHEETLEGAPAILETTVLTVKCAALFLGDTSGEGLGAPLLIHGHLTYTCEGGCKAKEKSLETLIEVLKLGHELADVTGKGEVKVVCGSISCTYNGEGLKGHALGPLLSSFENGDVTLENQPTKKVGGLFCPEIAELSILTMPLEATHITEGAKMEPPSTSTATSLCLEDPGTGEEEACPKEHLKPQLVTHVHEATSESSPAILVTNILTVKCAALFLGDTLGEGLGEPLLIHGHFTYTCEGGCEAKEVSTDTLIKILRLGHELADVEGSWEVNVHCGSLINCTYKSSGLRGHALGPLLSSVENGEVRIEEQTLPKVGGVLCSKTAELSVLTSPLSATYFSRGSVGTSTSLCPVDTSVENPKTEELEPEECPEIAEAQSEVSHVHEETLKGAPAILKTSIATVKCAALFLGDTLGEGLGEPLLIHGHLTYTCEGGCTAKEVSSDTLIEVLRLWHELADVTGKGEVKVVCGSISCTYKGEGLIGHALGPLLASFENGEVRLEEQETKKVGGLFCPKEAELSILTMPLEATYITS